MRTGVAVSDPGRILATPLAVVPTGEVSAHLSRLVGEEGVSEVVVGVPKNLGGEVGFQARKVLDTLDALRAGFPGVRFVEWDERFTTRIAASNRAWRSGNKRRGAVPVDDLAAARLLQEYLETRGHF